MGSPVFWERDCTPPTAPRTMGVAADADGVAVALNTANRAVAAHTIKDRRRMDRRGAPLDRGGAAAEGMRRLNWDMGGWSSFFQKPLTGLADGFGREERPYDGPVVRPPIHPGTAMGPRLLRASMRGHD